MSALGRRRAAPVEEESAGQSHSAEFLKLIFGGIGFGVAIMGYAYSSSFYSSFALNLRTLDYGALDIFFRGFALVQDWRVFLGFFGGIVVAAALLSLRDTVRPFLSYLMILLGFGGYLGALLLGGSHLGREHALRIISGDTGKPVYCSFHEVAETEPEAAGLVNALRQMTRAHELRLVHRSAETYFLSPTLDLAAQERKTGEVFVVPGSLVAGCRVVSSYRYGGSWLGAGG